MSNNLQFYFVALLVSISCYTAIFAAQLTERNQRLECRRRELNYYAASYRNIITFQYPDIAKITARKRTKSMKITKKETNSS